MIVLIIKIYIVTWLSMFLHEVAHLLSALFLRIKVARFKAGDEFFALHIGKVSVSPMVGPGYVAVYPVTVKGKRSGSVFFFSGALMNILIAVIVRFVPGISGIAMDYSVSFNISMAVFSLLPFVRGNDMNEYRSLKKAIDI
ncbi:MAG TPA: hypothetical protein DEO82_03155 [Eubacterium sp.]|nr:hypothetical protein [Eubacterium sp.]